MNTPQANVSRHSTDIILKLVAAALRGDLFRRFGLPFAEIVAALPTELPVFEVRTQKVDLLFRLADGSILHLEFQTTQKPGDLARFAAYNMAVYLHYRRPVHTVVLYGPGITSAPDTLSAGSLTFRVQNVLVGLQQGDAVVERLHDKVARGEPFNATDRVDLILLPLMSQTRPLETILQEARTAGPGAADGGAAADRRSDGGVGVSLCR